MLQNYIKFGITSTATLITSYKIYDYLNSLNNETPQEHFYYLNKCFKSIRERKISKLYKLIDQNPEIVNLVNSSGVSLLYFAVQTQNMRAIKFLLERGAKTEPDLVKDNHPILTPLNLAILEKDIRIVKILCDADAEVNKLNRDGYTPIHYAIKLKRDEEYIKILLDHGTDLSIKDASGFTPLHLAIMSNYSLDLLLNASTVNQRTKLGKSPLELALFSKNSAKNIYDLIKAGADVNLSNNKGENFLHTICNLYENNGFDIKIFKEVISQIREINLQNLEKDTALHLLTKGINTNTLSLYYKGHEEEIIKLFITAGANLKLVNNEGKTPLDYIIQLNELSSNFKDFLISHYNTPMDKEAEIDKYLVNDIAQEKKSLMALRLKEPKAQKPSFIKILFEDYTGFEVSYKHALGENSKLFGFFEDQ
jgi:ankyrin repeat protein